MAFTSGFFNSVNHDRKYDAVQMGQIFDGIIKDGIYATYLSAMVVKESANASEVIVQPGRAWFNHVWAYNDADYPMAAPDPEVVLDRIDTLVLDVNSEDAVREAKYMWVQGTPTSQIPEPPELIHTVTHNQYPLADVYRQAGTTQIYAADITNRVGTSDCPFVTGIIETINIDSLLTQWDAEFHTWEAATKNAFEGWMLNQEGAYTLWWNSMKSQMEDDVEELEAWIATIHDILDEEVATRLQAEIDEIKTQLPTGSYIKVTTTDTELFNRTVTITDEDNNTVTSTFNASGVAIFKTVPYVGYLTIESTDGIRVATNTVETPYFARYAFNLAFWSATVNISADTELGGETCVVKNSEAIVVTSIVLNAEGEGVFNATYPDTYTFSVTHGGETMEVSLAVTQETTYSVEIHAGFNWRGWLDASVDLDSSDYTDLDDVLSDEKAIRELFLVHDCVDYLAAVSTANTDVETILNNDLCAKWINNSDYALDTLSANAEIKAVMDEADKYGYGEWCLMPQVPTMTSNTAPYGEASATSYYNDGYDTYYPYKAFDGNDDDAHSWLSASGQGSNQRLSYKFTNPICPKKFKFSQHASYYQITSFKIQGSNDGTTWVDLYEGTSEREGIIENSDYYLYLGILANAQNTFGIRSLQFYAWAPKGVVPKMTSNSAPYGEASASTTYGTGYLAWNAFDKNNSTYWCTASGSVSNQYLGYKFTNPVNVKKVVLTNLDISGNATKVAKNCKLQYSNDGSTYQDVPNGSFVNDNTKIVNEFEFDTDIYALGWRVFITDDWGDNQYIYIKSLQFYGRQLSVSVPVMTSNTAPFGEAIVSSTYSSEYEGYKAFDNNGNTLWSSSVADAIGAYLGYDFKKLVNIKMLYVMDNNVTNNRPTSITIQGYTGSEWEDIQTISRSIQTTITDINGDAYTKFRVKVNSIGGTAGANNACISTLQFYGLDYSEKEFQAGSNKKWLYDHGVELETISVITNGGTATKEDSQLYFKQTAVGTAGFSVDNIDLTPYSLMRCKVGDIANISSDNVFAGLEVFAAGTAITQNSTRVAVRNITNNNYMPNNEYLDITSCDANYEVAIDYSGSAIRNAEFTIPEWWLE